MGLREHQRKTRAAYDDGIDGWLAVSGARQVDRAAALREQANGLILDLGCGPGWHMSTLAPAVGVDLSLEMTRQAVQGQPGAIALADMAALPFAGESLGGVWASRSLIHFPRPEIPMVLGELHRVLKADAHVCVWVFEGDDDHRFFHDDPLPGRTFSFWNRDALRRTFEGAGFVVDSIDAWEGTAGLGQLVVNARRAWSLPDFVGSDMRLLMCGLNPSPASADNGVGFHRAGNRFWPAALAAGLVTRDRDPLHALAEHGIGMTDLVKRTTRRADELSVGEYRAGLERVGHLVEWLEPQAVCLVGLAGWRAAVDRKAERGWQPDSIGGRPVYLMPSTSGLNAHDTVDTLADHLRTAAKFP